MHESLGRRIWAAGLTGIPFGIYKMGFGWYEYNHAHPTIGAVAITWGAIDIGLNVLALVCPGWCSWCLLSTVGRALDRRLRMEIWENILLAVDTTAAVLIVASMIWLGRLPLEPKLAATTWNLAVVGNVVSVGLEQLYRAIMRPGRAS